MGTHFDANLNSSNDNSSQNSSSSSSSSGKSSSGGKIEFLDGSSKQSTSSRSQGSSRRFDGSQTVSSSHGDSDVSGSFYKEEIEVDKATKERPLEIPKGKANKKPWDSTVKASPKAQLLVVFTFINCCIGSGLMAVPKIFTTIGFIVAGVYMVASTGYSVWIFSVLNKVNYHGNFESIAQLSKKVWGATFGRLVDVCMVINGIGSIIAYVSISADYIREGVRYFGNYPVLSEVRWQNYVKIIVAAAIIFPLSILRSINLISLISSFAILFALVTFLGVNVRFFQYVATGKLSGIEHPMPPVPVTPIPSKWMSTISYFTTFFALYTIHANITPMQYEIEGSPSLRKKTVKNSIIITMVIVVIIYIIIGVEGALLFDRSCTPEQVAAGCIPINSNILLAFGDDKAMLVIKLLYAVVILVSTPCMLYPVRLSICKWFNIDKYGGKTQQANIEDSKEVRKEFKSKSKEEKKLIKQQQKERCKTLPVSVRLGFLWYILVGLAIIIIDVVLSIAIPAIDKVLSVKSNIFGLVLYEMFGIFIFYRSNICEKFSVGALLDEHFNTTKLFLSEEDEGGIEIYSRRPTELFNREIRSDDPDAKKKIMERGTISLEDISKDKKKKKVSVASKIKRFSEIGIKNLGAAHNQTTKRSIIVTNPNAVEEPIKGLDIGQLQAELENNKNVNGGEVSWSETDSYSRNEVSMQKMDADGQDNEKLDKGLPLEDAGYTSTLLATQAIQSGAKFSPSLSLDGIKAVKAKSMIQPGVDGYRKMSALDYRSEKNSELIKGPVEIIFPELSAIPVKKALWKKAIFIAINVFFGLFNLTGLAFDIYSWIVPQ